MDSFEQEISEVSKKLDKLELEIEMSKEAIESIEIRLRLLKIELDFEGN